MKEISELENKVYHSKVKFLRTTDIIFNDYDKHMIF